MSENDVQNTDAQEAEIVTTNAGSDAQANADQGTTESSSVKQFHLDGVFWKRLIATFIDGVIIGVASLILIVPAMLILPAGFINFQALFSFFVSVAACAAFLLKDMPYRLGDILDGQSPGKKAMNLRVTDLNGGPITMEMSIKRNAIPALPYAVGGLSNLLNIIQIPIISGLATFFIILPLMGIAMLIVIFEVYNLYSGERNRRWGDTMAGTIVAWE